MPSTLVVILPLLPGKQEAWRQFCQVLQGSRHHEYDNCLRRMGITRQVVWLSQSVRCDAVQIHLDVVQCEHMVTVLATSTHPFDRWLRRSLLDLHGLDLSHFARSAHEWMLVWPPAPIEAAIPDQEQLHEPRRKQMKLEKNPTTGLVVELFGPTVEYLTSPDDERNDFCVLKGAIPPGGSVPLHSHADAEDFLVVSGAVEGLRHDTQGYTWVGAKAGDYLHVSGNAHHAWRNVSSKPVVMLMITTKRLGQFLKEVGRPVTKGGQPPMPEELARFAEVSARYGYWNATPEENAAVGINISL